MLIARDDEATLKWLQTSLARSVASEGIDDGLIAALNEILDGTAQAPSPSKRRRVRLSRPRQPERGVEAAPLPPGDAIRLVIRLRRATPQVIALASLYPIPATEIARLRALHEAQPEGIETVGYLRLFALALLAVLDQVDEDGT
ncbi:hypothetical protein ACWGI1_00535 [Streptomyces sp. NPDC054835]|uniref:hypothetical protein n=1 Tax=Streptomyces exfoliatus TaxID=1905 RepID=UPI00046388A2|nr:hypothetical protein [Streptomyces exfoliatus]